MDAFIFDRTLATFANLDHFGDLNEMILYTLTADETRGTRLEV